jgi:outer membrane biosynthesis protein TonB
MSTKTKEKEIVEETNTPKTTKSSAKPKKKKVSKKPVAKKVSSVEEEKTVENSSDTVETKEEARKLEGEELQKAIENQTNAMKIIITRSTNGKTQQRMVGSRKFKNNYGHFYGTIGSKIDRLIENGAFTKKQIQNYAGTKMSKVNSHISHLRKDVKKEIVIDPKTKKVSFG